MNTEEKLRELVNYAIHHLSCGYTSNDERVLALQHLQRGLHNIEAAQHLRAPDTLLKVRRPTQRAADSVKAEDEKIEHGVLVEKGVAR